MTNSIVRSRLLPAIFFLAALVYTLPFLLHLFEWGLRDWDRAFLMAAVPGDAILRYSQFPFWNPYIAGGNIFFHHPEVLVFSPFLVLYLIFGPVIGLKLQILICYFFGFWGSYTFAQRMGLSIIASIMTALAYFGSIYFALHFAEGHVMFGDFCLLPWFLVFVLDSVANRKKLFWAAGVLALMILGNGGAVPLLYTILFSLLFFFCYSIQTKSARPLLSSLYATLIAVSLSAVKFIPMLVYMSANNWGGAPQESIPLSALGSVFFGFDHTLFSKHFDGQVWAWQEYGAYISPLLLILAVIALAVKFRKVWLWLALLLFFLLLGIGDFGMLSPWSVLSHLPGFSYARCTGRAFQFVILSCAILGGIGYDWLYGRIKQVNQSSFLPKLLCLIPVVVIATNIALAWPVMNSAFRYPPQAVERDPVFAQVIDKEPQVYKNFLANHGSLISPMISLYKPSRALVGAKDSVLTDYQLSGVAHITKRLYTPNRIEYAINAETSGELAISAGYDPGWQTSDGRALKQYQGLIVIPFTAGEQTVTLSYRTPWFFTGLFLSFGTILLCLRKFI